MRYLDLTLPSAAENLALDEALLEEAEAGGRPAELLRLWEPAEPMVVVGRSSRIDAEVHRRACQDRGIPILRRASGGAAIVTGPGCLMYALVLSYELRPTLRAVDHAHRFVLGRLASALRPLVPEVACRGTSDLAIGEGAAGNRTGPASLGGEAPRAPAAVSPGAPSGPGTTRRGVAGAGVDGETRRLSRASLKFSGNSMRCKRTHLLYHGTLLYRFRLELIEACLAMPPRHPEYRQGRTHRSFVANLPLPAGAIRQVLVTAWDATEPCVGWPREETAQLVAEKYGRQEWNERR